jgi:large subunit ribosomal protein L32
LVTCPHCGALIQAHHVCPECGFYDGKDVLHLSKEKGEPAKK